MKVYHPSTLENGDSAILRDLLFTPWLTPDALQEHTERMGEMGMFPLYSEYEAGSGFREIYWTPPTECFFEIRSGRGFDEFYDFAEVNEKRGWPLLTLHRNAEGFHSAVWFSESACEAALPLLESLGIRPATSSEVG